jgi:hypothetical protein
MELSSWPSLCSQPQMEPSSWPSLCSQPQMHHILFLCYLNYPHITCITASVLVFVSPLALTVKRLVPFSQSGSKAGTSTDSTQCMIW